MALLFVQVQFLVFQGTSIRVSGCFCKEILFVISSHNFPDVLMPVMAVHSILALAHCDWSEGKPGRQR
jgi:hypothetical protein